MSLVPSANSATIALGRGELAFRARATSIRPHWPLPKPHWLDLYMARRMLVPTLSTIGITIALMVLQYMPTVFTRIMQGGGDSGAVWRMLAYLLPEYFDLSLPISLLLGTVLACRALNLASEMDGLAACGIGPFRILRMPIAIAAVIAVLSIVMTGYVQPLSAYAYDSLVFRAKLGDFGIPVQPGRVNRLTDDTALSFREFNSRSGRMRGVFLQTHPRDGADGVFTAQSGAFIKTKNERDVILRLLNGRLALTDPVSQAITVLDFRQYDVAIHIPKAAAFRSRGGREVEMTLPELNAARSDPSLTPELRRLAGGELQRRIILTLICFVVPFLGIAVAKPPLRSTSAGGVVAGLVMLVLMLKALDIGVQAVSLPAAPLLWGSFLLFVLVSARLYHILARTPGGQPLSYLYDLAGALGDVIHRLQVQRGRARW